MAEQIVYYVENNEQHHWNGVAVNLIRKAARTMLHFSDRIILVKLQGTPVNTNMFLIYEPTAYKLDEHFE